jgi:hypothetical protein
MKEIGMLFSTPMVQAIDDNRKRQRNYSSRMDLLPEVRKRN